MCLDDFNVSNMKTAINLLVYGVLGTIGGGVAKGVGSMNIRRGEGKKA